jgi:uncharacterized BrkB/YihY/UPF0761 family membrane protein
MSGSSTKPPAAPATLGEPVGPPSATAVDDGTEPETLAELVAALANQPLGTSWVERKRARALALAERVTSHGPLAVPAEIGWQVNRCLYRVGSGALAALIAYRVFVWLLPLAVVAVAALGLYADETDTSASGIVERFGLAGYFATSVAQTATTTGGSGRWLALVLGALFLVYQTYTLLRATSAVHSLAWGVRVVPVRRPASATLSALALLAGALVAASMLRTLPDRLGTVGGTLAVLGAYAVPTVAWLLASSRLPHRASRWTGLVPGAVVVGIAFALLHAFNVFLLVPWLESKEETYGVLGVAAGILVTLYLLGWAIASGAALNRVLEDRRQGVRPHAEPATR